MKKKVIRVKWKNICITLMLAWIIYSFIGMIIGPELEKENDSICKGFKYGFKICVGNQVKE